MPRKKKPSVPAETFTMSVNGHQLTGMKRDGLWTFTCPSWPDLAEKWTGDTITDNILGEYMKRAMAGTVTIRAAIAAMARY